MSVLSGTRNVTSNVLMVMLGMIGGKILSFVWRGMLSGEMSATGFSDFVTFFICINIASQVAFTPVNELIARETVFRHQSRSTILHFLQLYGAACILAIIMNCGMMLGFSFIYGRTELQGVLIWTALLPPLAGALMFLVAMFRAVGDHVSRSLFYLVGIHLFFVLLLMMSGDRTLDGTVWLFFASYLLAALLCGAYFRGWYPFKNSPSPYVADLSQQVKFILPMFFVQALDATSSWVDSIVLGGFLYEAMGAYSNISFLAKAVLMANSALYFVIVPVFANLLHPDHKHRLAYEYKKRTHHLALVVTPPALFLFAYAHELLALIFSIKDPDMGYALQILVIGYWGATLLGPILALTLAEGKTVEILISTVAFILLNIIFSLLLAPAYGVVGVAIAASGSYLVSVLYLFYNCSDRAVILSHKVIPFALGVGSLTLGVVWLLSFVGGGVIMEITLGGAVVVVLSLGAYLVLLATTQERLLIRSLYRGEG